MIEPIETNLSASELFDQPDLSSSPWWPEEDMPGANGEPWLEVERLPRGKYFIGDPCHVFPEYHFRVPEGAALDIEGIGRVFWVSMDDFGCCTDQITSYYYDSMAVGIFPVDHLSPGHWAALKTVGRLIEWTNGDLIPEDEDEDWENATCVGFDFLGNVYLGNDWWFTHDFEENPLFPQSLAHLRSALDTKAS